MWLGLTKSEVIDRELLEAKDYNMISELNKKARESKQQRHSNQIKLILQKQMNKLGKAFQAADTSTESRINYS